MLSLLSPPQISIRDPPPFHTDPGHRPHAAALAGWEGSRGGGSCDQDAWLCPLHSAAGTAGRGSSVLQWAHKLPWAPPLQPQSPSPARYTPTLPVPLTCDGLIETSLVPRAFLFLFFSLLLLLSSLAASPAALHLGQALLQGFLELGQGQLGLLTSQELQAAVIGRLGGGGKSGETLGSGVLKKAGR